MTSRFKRGSALGRTVVVAVLLGALAVTGTIVGVALARSISPPYRLYVPPPVITSGPPSPTQSRSATFVYTDALQLITFRCSLDGSRSVACGTLRPSSFSYSRLPEGWHTFEVRAVAGTLVSRPTRWSWRIESPPPPGWSITGAPPAGDLLYPGGGDVPLDLTFSNPGSLPLQITSVTATITDTSSGACATSNFTIAQQFVGSVTVPANSVVSLEQLGVPPANWPQLRMLETGTDQDACQNASVDLSFSGQAQ